MSIKSLTMIVSWSTILLLRGLTCHHRRQRYGKDRLSGTSSVLRYNTPHWASCVAKIHYELHVFVSCRLDFSPSQKAQLAKLPTHIRRNRVPRHALRCLIGQTKDRVLYKAYDAIQDSFLNCQYNCYWHQYKILYSSRSIQLQHFLNLCM